MPESIKNHAKFIFRRIATLVSAIQCPRTVKKKKINPV